MAEALRDYADEKKAVYDAMVSIKAARPKKEKSKRMQMSEIREASGLPVGPTANAVKWLGRKGMAHTEDGRDGWFLDRLNPKHYERYCWKHGIVKEIVGKGKNKRYICPMCERNPERKEN